MSASRDLRGVIHALSHFAVGDWRVQRSLHFIGGSGLQGYRVTGSQGYRITGFQGYRPNYLIPDYLVPDYLTSCRPNIKAPDKLLALPAQGYLYSQFSILNSQFSILHSQLPSFCCDQDYTYIISAPC
jgi:hypothetical protein